MNKNCSGAPGVHRSIARQWCALALSAAASHAVAQAEAPDRAPATFDVWEYRVLGNTVLPRADIETLLYAKLGPGKTLDDVEKARLALEAAYRDRGYGTVFVDIPEQEVDEGIVRLRVTEGTVNRVRVSGSRYFSNRQIKNAVPAAAPGVVPHLPTVQQQLADLNSQTVDRSVVPVMKAGPRPGTVDLNLTVQDEAPFHGSVEVNDQYTGSTSKLRASLALSYDDMFGRLDSLALQYQVSPQDMDEVGVLAASYTLRLPDARSKVAFFYINSDSDIATVGGDGGDITVLGKGQIFGTRYIKPLYTAADATHVFIGSAEYKDFDETVLSSDLLRTPISYMNLSAGHTSAWRTAGQTVSLASSVNFGVRGMGNGPEEFRDKRAHARPNYWNLRAETSYSLQLPWRLHLRLRGAGQYAVEPIISNEQFSIAGADGVRGYMEAEQLGDIGFKSLAELVYAPIELFAQRVQAGAFVFYDFGRMSRLEPLRDRQTGALAEVADQTFRSAGAGVEFSAFGMLSGSLSWAYPFVDSPDDGTRAGDSRIHFSIRSSW